MNKEEQTPGLHKREDTTDLPSEHNHSVHNPEDHKSSLSVNGEPELAAKQSNEQVLSSNNIGMDAEDSSLGGGQSRKSTQMPAGDPYTINISAGHYQSGDVVVDEDGRIIVKKNTQAAIQEAMRIAKKKGRNVRITGVSEKAKRLAWIEGRRQGIPERKIRGYSPTPKDKASIDREQKKRRIGADEKQKSKGQGNSRVTESSSMDMQRPTLMVDYSSDPPSYSVGGRGAASMLAFVEKANNRMDELHESHGGGISAQYPAERDNLHLQIQEEFNAQLSKFEQQKHQHQNEARAKQQQGGANKDVKVDLNYMPSGRRSAGHRIGGRKLTPGKN